MNSYYIDFSGYCEIEANSREEAEAKFWEGIQTPSKEAFNDVWDIESIELNKEANSVHLISKIH